MGGRMDFLAELLKTPVTNAGLGINFFLTGLGPIPAYFCFIYRILAIRIESSFFNLTS